MVIYKCNRCKKEMDKEELLSIEIILKDEKVKTEIIGKHHFSLKETKIKEDRISNIHLCANCTSDFDKFLKEKENEKVNSNNSN